jgi:hypothetical protein
MLKFANVFGRWEASLSRLHAAESPWVGERTFRHCGAATTRRKESPTCRAAVPCRAHRARCRTVACARVILGSVDELSKTGTRARRAPAA